MKISHQSLGLRPVSATCLLGESPFWHPQEQCLYWVDIPGRQICRLDPVSGQELRWDVPSEPGCIAPSRHGGLLVAHRDGIDRFDPVEGRCLERIVDAPYDPTLQRFNDGRCDRQGRLLAGTMVGDMSLAAPAGSLYALGDGSPRVLQTGLITPNGMAFSPDGATMYLSDSHPQVQTVWAFDYDTRTGTPHNQRVFIDFKPLPGRPDGAAVDAEGCYWVCGNDAGLVHRFTPSGRLDRSLAVPVKKPAMCAFGGAGLDTLFVTSIRPGGDLTDQPLAGGVFALRPGVRGLAEPVCAIGRTGTD